MSTGWDDVVSRGGDAPAPVMFPIEAGEIKMRAAGEAGEKSSKTDHAPFIQIKRLKKNSLHQAERFAKWLEDFDLRLAFVHNAIRTIRPGTIKLSCLSLSRQLQRKRQIFFPNRELFSFLPFSLPA